MSNCLVTKLKSSVNNESLSKLNVLTIKTKASESPTVYTQWINIGTSENGSVSINSSNVGLYQSGISGELKPYPVTVLANSSIEAYFENKDGIIEVDGKYNLNNIIVGNNGTVRIKEIYGIPGTIKTLVIRGNLEEVEVDATKLVNAIDLGELKNIELPMRHGELTLDMVNRISKNTIGEFKAIMSINSAFCLLFDGGIGLDDIADSVNVQNIDAYQLKGGNLSSLAKLTKLKNFIFYDDSQNTGDIMDFINPWIQSGRTSGKLKTMYMRGQKGITLNGQPITYPEGVNTQNAYLNWTSDGTVTFTAS